MARCSRALQLLLSCPHCSFLSPAPAALSLSLPLSVGRGGGSAPNASLDTIPNCALHSLLLHFTSLPFTLALPRPCSCHVISRLQPTHPFFILIDSPCLKAVFATEWLSVCPMPRCWRAPNDGRENFCAQYSGSTALHCGLLSACESPASPPPL